MFKRKKDWWLSYHFHIERATLLSLQIRALDYDYGEYIHNTIDQLTSEEKYCVGDDSFTNQMADFKIASQ